MNEPILMEDLERAQKKLRILRLYRYYYDRENPFDIKSPPKPRTASKMELLELHEEALRMSFVNQTENEKRELLERTICANDLPEEDRTAFEIYMICHDVKGVIYGEKRYRKKDVPKFYEVWNKVRGPIGTRSKMRHWDEDKITFDVFYSEDDEGYIATCLDYPGLSAFGETEEEAMKQARFALELFREEEIFGNREGER
jgi:predicted RNase H-like HicB family nuclease